MHLWAAGKIGPIYGEFFVNYTQVVFMWMVLYLRFYPEFQQLYFLGHIYVSENSFELCTQRSENSVVDVKCLD